MTENNHITIVAPSPIIAVVILLYGGFTAFMCMHQIRAVFAVNTTTMLSTLGAALLAAILSGILILI